MILYFSGTGNSQYVAEQIAEKTGDELISINKLLKEGRKETLVSEEKPFVFVCPVYAWQLPRVVETFIRETTFQGPKEAYFIMTCGGETANAIHHVRYLCVDKGWYLRGFAEILMPDNYLVMFPAIDKEVEIEKNHQADILIHKIGEEIQENKEFVIYKRTGIKGTLQSSLVNALFYPLYVKAKGFHTTEKCIGCKQCVDLCPLNNITMEGDRPVWGNRCTHCMACICGCPTEAIEYKNKTQGKPRYQLKNYR